MDIIYLLNQTIAIEAMKLVFFTISPRITYKYKYKPEASGWDDDEKDNYKYVDMIYYYNKPKIGYWDFDSPIDSNDLPTDIYNANGKPGFDNFPAMISEATGAFIFIFLFMLCTDKKTQYTEDKVINCFIMSASYCAARLMGAGGLITVLNESYQAVEKQGDEWKKLDWVYK